MPTYISNLYGDPAAQYEYPSRNKNRAGSKSKRKAAKVARRNNRK